MSIFKKAKAWLLDDWCTECVTQMNLRKKQLFCLPMTVGHFTDYEDPHYYTTHLTKVSKKADIPVGVYACGAHLYQCPKCQKKLVKLTIFLPVRDQEQIDGIHVFDDPNIIKLIEECSILRAERGNWRARLQR